MISNQSKWNDTIYRAQRHGGTEFLKYSLHLGVSVSLHLCVSVSKENVSLRLRKMCSASRGGTRKSAQKQITYRMKTDPSSGKDRTDLLQSTSADMRTAYACHAYGLCVSRVRPPYIGPWTSGHNSKQFTSSCVPNVPQRICWAMSTSCSSAAGCWAIPLYSCAWMVSTVIFIVLIKCGNDRYISI